MAKEYKLKDLASLSLKPGQKEEYEVEGVEDAKVLLVNTGGSISALGSKCTHYGAPLKTGVLTPNGRITCPWHGACFNGKTGDVEDAPALDNLAVFKLTERDGAVYVTGEEATLKSGHRKPNIKCGAAAARAASDKVVIVGGGSGTIGAIEALRSKGYKGALTVISSEGYRPIDRTKLSKALITDLSKLEWRDKAWFDEGAVDWVDDEVVDIDFDGRVVSTKNSQSVPYTKLILATGGNPRNLPLQGFKVLGNIFTLRNFHDSKQIVDGIGQKGKKIVVIGSSFIGLEIAAATAEGNTVTVVGNSKVPLDKVLGERIGADVQKLLEKNGVKFHMSANVDRAEPSTADASKVGAVLLKDGTRLEADLVVLGVGVAPATEYLQKNKSVSLEKDGSLQTDENYLVNGLKDVYAIGDIATSPYHGPGGEGRPTRIEHWNVAQNAGRIAATHIIDPSTPAERFTPIFWSRLGANMRYCGNTQGGYDDVIVQGSVLDAKFVAYYTKGEVVVAVATMGTDPAMAQAAELMRLGKMPSKAEVASGVDVRKVAFA